MMQFTRRASLGVVLLLPSRQSGTASAECTSVSLRTFTSEERGRFEEQYGIGWWKVIGLIPGPAQPGDWAERHWGDSSRMVYMPQQFWDLRSCVADTDRLPRPTARAGRRGAGGDHGVEDRDGHAGCRQDYRQPSQPGVRARCTGHGGFIHSRPWWLAWLGWFLTSVPAILYIVLDYPESRRGP